jgi:hypothetical protein
MIFSDWKLLECTYLHSEKNIVIAHYIPTYIYQYSSRVTILVCEKVAQNVTQAIFCKTLIDYC